MSLDSLEPSPISQTKQDPAWKHCQLFVKKNANGVKEELKKCTYCGKFFKGGGIHRIKEHLAGRKGNGPTCDQVPSEVRFLMKQVLNARNSGAKKNRTQIIISTTPSVVDHTPLKLIEAPDLGCTGGGVGNESVDQAFIGSISAPNLDLLANQEEDVATSNVSVDGRKRRRDLNASVLDPSASANSNGGIDFSSPSPVPCEIDNVFANHARSKSGGAPNSKLLVNHEEEEEEIGIGSTSMDRKKRFRGENSLVAMDAGVVNNDIELERKKNQEIQMAIGRFLYEIGAPLDAVKDSVYFQPMIDAIVSGGTGVVPPSYHDLRGWILKSAVEEVKHDVQQYMGTWRRTGCSILVNRRYSQKGKTFLTFTVYCPERTLFLKSVDASAIIYSPDALYELLKQVVEEVGVEHVLQVITDNTEKLIVAGKRLMDTIPTLYWVPCVAHCINLILEDFGKLEWINSIIEQARSITRFVYKHSMVLNMMKKFTFGNDIVKPGLTPIATNFMTLKQMAELKLCLQSMVTSQEWMECPFSKQPGGLTMLHTVTNRSFWSSCILISRLTSPLLRVLRIVGSEKRAAMGYIYAGMYRAKEAIKRELVERRDYMAYWNIIAHRWEQQRHPPLHAAGFYLNPKFFYSLKGCVHNGIMSAMFDCIERLVPDTKVQDKIIKEINSYKNAVGDLGRNLAIRSRDTLLPVEWWSTYGGGCPNLARLAVRILSQTCSSISYKQSQISFEHIYETRNCLERQRFSDLFFVQCNLRLRQMVHKNKEHDYMDPISFDCMSLVEDWVMEKEVCFEDCGSSDWVSLNPPTTNTMQLGALVDDDAEDLGIGFDDNEIFDGSK